MVGGQEANKGPEEEDTERENSMKKKNKKSTTKGQEEVVKQKGKKTKRRGSHEEEGAGRNSRYVFMVSKRVHPELAISSEAMAVLNAFMWT